MEMSAPTLFQLLFLILFGLLEYLRECLECLLSLTQFLLFLLLGLFLRALSLLVLRRYLQADVVLWNNNIISLMVVCCQNILQLELHVKTWETLAEAMRVK